MTQIPDLAHFVRAAWAAGQSAKLDGIGYGRITWGNETEVLTDCGDWEIYLFLNGVVSLIGAKSILEIGTHWGGSARAMARGMKEGGKIVTVDKSEESDAVLPTCPESTMIQKIVGDANSFEVIEQVYDALPSADIIFIDATHAALPTLQSLTTYSLLLRPTYVLIDDITLNDSMVRFWKLVRKTYPDRSIDCHEVEAVRQPHVGFGLIYMPTV